LFDCPFVTLTNYLDPHVFCYYIKYMIVEFDQEKRNKTLQERGLDFARAGEVLAGPVLTKERHQVRVWGAAFRYFWAAGL
jgi:hypothetical protein